MALPCERANRVVPHSLSASGTCHSQGAAGQTPYHLYAARPGQAGEIQNQRMVQIQQSFRVQRPVPEGYWLLLSADLGCQ